MKLKWNIIFFWLILSLIAALNLAGPASAEPSAAEKLYQKARTKYYSLKRDKADRKGRTRWIDGIQSFLEVYRLDPKGDKADDALFSAANLSLDLYLPTRNASDLEEALSLYQKLYHEYPQSNLADDAIFAEGIIQKDFRKSVKESISAFKKLVELYPDGDMAEKSREQLRELSPEPAAASSSKAKSSDAGGRLVAVKEVKHWSNPDYTRVVIHLESDASFKKDFAKEPDRFFIDIWPARISRTMMEQPLEVGDGLLKRVRMGQNKPDVVRVVLDIETLSTYKVFTIDNPFRIVIDAMARKVADERVKTVLSRMPKWIDSAKPGRVIVLDAGHGGDDTGAIGPGGLQEKDVALKVAKQLAVLLGEKFGPDAKVVLTRDKDIFVPLEERTAIANMANADLFVSIHTNAHEEKQVAGVETYFLNIASGDDAMRVAARENMATMKQVSDLQDIMNDLIATSKMKESSLLASSIQGSLISGLRSKYSRVRNLGVKQAPFYVLIGAHMPSVLVEIGFISNPFEERRLGTLRFQKLTASSIYSGLKSYLDKYGPTMTSELKKD